MKKKMFLLFLFLVVMLISCTRETTWSNVPQQCPSWTKSEGFCTITLTKQNISSERSYSLENYDQVSITTIGDEVLINNAVGVKFLDDKGEVIDHENTRISPSTFIVVKNVLIGESRFTLRNPNSSTIVTLSLEFVKFQQEN